jgi:hypothetical protein
MQELDETRVVDSPKAGARSGKPLTVYFSGELAESLNRVSSTRHVSKAALVRFAVERLLHQLQDGQLNLPLGIE